MSKLNLGCVFCEKEELDSEGSILIERTDWNDAYWLEMFHLDNRTITSYITRKMGWDPVCELPLQINYCPMCGRKLYSGKEERNNDYEFKEEEK